MKVPEMTAHNPGTVGYLRVPSRTFAYQLVILLMILTMIRVGFLLLCDDTLWADKVHTGLDDQ